MRTQPFLVAAARSDLVECLVMLEGHVAGSDDPGDAVGLGRFFASWPVPFTDGEEARAFLGSGAIVAAWIADLEMTPEGLRPRFDADVMQRTIEAVHEPRWAEWEALQVPALAVFAKEGMFSEADKTELGVTRNRVRSSVPKAGRRCGSVSREAWVLSRSMLGRGEGVVREHDAVVLLTLDPAEHLCRLEAREVRRRAGADHDEATWAEFMQWARAATTILEVKGRSCMGHEAWLRQHSCCPQT